MADKFIVTDGILIGNSTVNAAINSTSFSLNGSAFGGGGGYYKGSSGTVGSPSNANNVFRINANTLFANVTITANDNTICIGPLTIDTGVLLVVETGGRVVIV